MPRWTALTDFTRRRVLREGEYAWALDVFGPTLPPRDRIRLSPALGLQRRPFTFPGPRRITVFLGPDAVDPVRTNPALFAHELTHVWQIHHAPHRLPWLARAVVTQIRHSLGRDVYGIGAATAPWRAYTIEQQATVVEHWVRDRHGPEGRRLQHYLDEEIRAAGSSAR
ncbi:hypothetical protein ACXR2U_10935 [Jatrophihabitans sp. YIM 134969]